MQQFTAIIGAAFIFAVVFLFADFLVVRAGEDWPDWGIGLGMIASGAIAFLAALSSYRASLRRGSR